VNWSPEARLTNAPNTSRLPDVFVSGAYVHLVWNDARSGDYEIYHKLSSNGGFNWGSDTRLTISAGLSEMPSVGAGDSKVHVVWTDERDGRTEIYYKRNPTGNPVGITSNNSEIPDKFSLGQNYPNPFNPVTNIEFAVPRSSFVKLTVYDITGREASALVNQQLQAGTYIVDFDASGLSSGAYFYRIESEDYAEVKKMLMIK
jgi:hypothetical protein